MENKNIISIIAKELDLNEIQVKNTLGLLDEEKTIPFIARYRKEVTGTLDEVQIKQIKDRSEYLSQLSERKESILASIEEQGKLSPELKAKIISAPTLTELEDLYLPYKQKRRTRAMIAKEKGLEPLAELFIKQGHSDKSITELCEAYIDFEHDLFTQIDVLKGVQDILAEHFSENAEYRKWIRTYLIAKANITSQGKAESEQNEYQQYLDYSETIRLIPPHRILAIFRGEAKKALKVSFDYEIDAILEKLEQECIKNNRSIWAETLKESVLDSYKRLIYPSIEREIRQYLKEKAELHAIEVFGENLKNLLLQAPLTNKVIMGIDPGFRSGSKASIIDETGKHLGGETIYPHPPQNQYTKSIETLTKLVEKHNVEVIAIGNGTASRETEQLVADLISKKTFTKPLSYIIVNEAGASVYSASEVAREEFPDMDVAMRGAVSIARRLMDPLAELVKIDPKSIGVGLYQHDVDQKKLNDKLEFIIETCVNHVGVDLNTASVELLKQVAGLTKRTAKNITDYRNSIGAFKNRKELLKVTGIGASAFEQSAGFLRIVNGNNPLDNTSIHPESYDITKKLLKQFQINDIAQGGAKLKNQIERNNITDIANQYEVGIPTLEDILLNIEKHGRDPRESFEKPILRSDVLSFGDLYVGIELKGTVRNVIDFGAFVDIGLKNDGLVHVSQLADKFVKNPAEIVSVGDIVDVRVISLDEERQRVGLSMKKD
jgi:protein Tex